MSFLVLFENASPDLWSCQEDMVDAILIRDIQGGAQFFYFPILEWAEITVILFHQLELNDGPHLLEVRAWQAKDITGGGRGFG